MARKPLPRAAVPFSNAFQLALMATEANAIITMRMMGMAGLWSVSPGENMRMVSEKMFALTDATREASDATLRGKSAAEITAAAIKPLRKTTRANARRLGRRGLK